MKSYPRLLFLIAVLAIIPLAITPAVAHGESANNADPLDWVNWRGPGQNRTSLETNLVAKWKPKGGPGSNVLWKNEECAGISTPIVMNGKLYTIVRSNPNTPRDGEKVVCLNAATGEKLWQNAYNVYLSDVPADRVGWSSVVGDPETGKVYVLGACGLFQCLDGSTGKTLWSHSMHERYGLLSTYGGRTNFPVVFDDLVIISAVMINWGDFAKPQHSFIAFDKNTGEEVWFSGTRPLPDDTTYSTPTLTVFNGEAAMVFGAGDGAVWAFQPRTGVPIWHYNLSRRGLFVSPLVVGNTVYIGHGEENLDTTAMGAVAAINGLGKGDITTSGEIWRKFGMGVGRGQLIRIEDRIYAVTNSAKLHILDAETGEPISKRPISLLGTAIIGAPLYADGKLYICTTSAWNVLVPTPQGVRVVNRMRFPRDATPVLASPIVSHGRIYLTTASGLFCIGKEGVKPTIEGEPTPNGGPESPIADNPNPTHVQLVPVDVLLRPGESKQFRVRLFNANGQFLRESEAKFTLNGPGSVDANGLYKANRSDEHTATTITAKVGDISGQARIRVIPDLPWRFDFNATKLGPGRTPNSPPVGLPPLTWIGARYRHVVRDLDGERVLVKVTTIPKGTRSQCWMGHPNLHDYTIQADVRGALTRGSMPSIGLIAQGYILDTAGGLLPKSPEDDDPRHLQIRTWSTTLRMAKTVPFVWQPDTWYTMKFRAALENGKAVLRGKVWKRGESEPSGWMIEATDDAPNLTGSPGLYGDATTSELYYDNVIVTSND